MTHKLELTDVQATDSGGVLTLRYEWIGGSLPQDGPVALITSFPTTGKSEPARRFGMQWVDGAFSSKYVFDEAAKPMNNYTSAQAYDLPTGQSFRAQFFDDALGDLAGELPFTAVITVSGTDVTTFRGTLQR